MIKYSKYIKWENAWKKIECNFLLINKGLKDGSLMDSVQMNQRIQGNAMEQILLGSSLGIAINPKP